MVFPPRKNIPRGPTGDPGVEMHRDLPLREAEHANCRRKNRTIGISYVPFTQLCGNRSSWIETSLPVQRLDFLFEVAVAGFRQVVIVDVGNLGGEVAGIVGVPEEGCLFMQQTAPGIRD